MQFIKLVDCVYIIRMLTFRIIYFFYLQFCCFKKYRIYYTKKCFIFYFFRYKFAVLAGAFPLLGGPRDLVLRCPRDGVGRLLFTKIFKSSRIRSLRKKWTNKKISRSRSNLRKKNIQRKVRDLKNNNTGGSLIRTGQKTFFCKSGRAKI